MKIKLIIPGEHYILSSGEDSVQGYSKEYFLRFIGQQVTVISKKGDNSSNNNVLIQGVDNTDQMAISFWCSSKDLKEV